MCTGVGLKQFPVAVFGCSCQGTATPELFFDQAAGVQRSCCNSQGTESEPSGQTSAPEPCHHGSIWLGAVS